MTKPEDNSNDDPSQNGEDTDAKFGLNEPTGQFMDLNERMEREKEAAEALKASSREEESFDPDDSVKYRNMGWKGVDDDDQPLDEEEDEPEVSFGDKEPIPEDELDMTPMVDVTFLLLIFFMVTASFTIQKSLEQPHAKTDDPTVNPTEDQEQPEDYVQVLIDQTNTFYVTSRSEDEAECPSDSEMRAKVRNAFESEGARRLVIVAHLDSLHKKVVTAWDTGVLNDAQEIQIQTTDEDY
jgi:biopolymer transport protein ExbD